jgi:hypothetical protein
MKREKHQSAARSLGTAYYLFLTFFNVQQQVCKRPNLMVLDLTTFFVKLCNLVLDRISSENLEMK